MRFKTVFIRVLCVLVIIFCILATVGFSTLMEKTEVAFVPTEQRQSTEAPITPFPVSVDPEAGTIIQEDLLNSQILDSLALNEPEPTSLTERVVAFFYRKEWYQNLASPVSRVLVIWPGERQEEVVDFIGDVLRWNTAERKEFVSLIAESEPVLQEGKFFPGQYIAHRDATPADVATLIQEQFETDVLSRYTPEVAEKVPLKDALVIASMLEREASDFENMREISGVIWNRLFIDMPLQLDATLQYIKADGSGDEWWPVPKPADKFLRSPYNTYLNAGLPPGPIANPSAAAILATLNPYPTDCMFYFHDRKGGYHCSVTYEEHVRKLKIHYGRGR